MSAWIVSENHITALVCAGLRFSHPGDDLRYRVPAGDSFVVERLSHANATEVGQMLWLENRASVNHRYEEDTEIPAYEYPVKPMVPGMYAILTGPEPHPYTPVEILKLLSCYEYQSCEHDGWETSAAKAYCDALRNAAIDALPGYDAAPWGID